MSSFRQKMSRIRTEFAAFGWKIINDWSFSLGALIAYYLLISMFPLVLCLFSATYLIFGNDQYFVNQTRDRLLESFPNQNFDELIINLADSIGGQAVVVFIVSFLVAIFAGSRLFIGIDDVLVIIYRMRERTILGQNFHAIKMLLVFITLMPVIIVSSSVLALLKKQEKFYYFLIVFLSGIFLFLLFMTIYYFVPSRTMRWGKMFVDIFTRISQSLLILVGVEHYVQLLPCNWSSSFSRCMFIYL